MVNRVPRKENSLITRFMDLIVRKKPLEQAGICPYVASKRQNLGYFAEINAKWQYLLSLKWDLNMQKWWSNDQTKAEEEKEDNNTMAVEG